MAEWPATLPDNFMAQGYTESPGQNVLETPMEVGPPKRRRRSTAARRPITGKMHMTDAQVEILDAFYEDDCGSGALPFTWTHPRTGAAATFYFKAQTPPKYANIGGDEWEVSIELEKAV